jgi:hypothetical protein
LSGRGANLVGTPVGSLLSGIATDMTFCGANVRF